jgi:hypothetical protein
MPVVSATIP